MSIFQKIGAFFIRFFSFAVKEARKYSNIAVLITAELKKVVESPAADVVVNLIPGQLDNVILLQARKVLAQVSLKLALVYGIVGENDQNHDVIARLIEYVKTQTKDKRIDFWVRFAGELNMAFADGKIDIAEGIALTQMAFKELFPDD